MDIIFKIQKYLRKNSNLIKTVVMIALAVVCIVQAVTTTSYKSSYEEEVKSGSTMQSELDTLQMKNRSLESQLSEYATTITERDNTIVELQNEVTSLKAKLEDAASTPPKYEVQTEYAQSAQIWRALKGLGLNDYVCAGILGNIMAEVGGQTLDFSNWEHWSQGTHYGICQWGGSRKDRLLNDFGTTFNDQVRFLTVELFEVIPKDNSFYNMQDEQEAALYFAKYYERCSSRYYEVRQVNATKALAYFSE